MPNTKTICKRYHPAWKLLLIIAILATACGGRTTPQAEGAYRALKRIEGATAVGVSKMKYDELLQNAAAELLILADLTPNSQDTLTLRHYQAAIKIYKDAGELWGEEISGARYGWIPEGKIYLESAGRRIAQTYHLSTDTVTASYETKFNVVSKGAISELWQRAGTSVQAGDSLIVARLRKM